MNVELNGDELQLIIDALDDKHNAYANSGAEVLPEFQAVNRLYNRLSELNEQHEKIRLEIFAKGLAREALRRAANRDLSQTICGLDLVADLNEKSGFLHWEMGQQTVYDLAEKHALSLDLIEKKSGRNDSVYELTEIDNGAGMFQQGGRLVGKAKPAMRATAPAYAKSSLGKSFGPL